MSEPVLEIGRELVDLREIEAAMWLKFSGPRFAVRAFMKSGKQFIWDVEDEAEAVELRDQLMRYRQDS